jgi:DNA-binding transcriptional MerR regulator
MAETDDAQIVMPPKEAARQLGVAASTLRRLAPTYEAVHGPLPWEGDEAGGGRLWPAEAVERVQDARALVAEGRAKSLESALRALAGGAPPPIGVLSRPDEATALIEALREELRADREDRQALREEVAALREELASSRALPPGANATPKDDETATRHGLLVRLALWLEGRLGG